MSFLDKFLNVMRLNPDDDDDFYNEDYDYDDDEEEYYCDVNLDEDEYYRFVNSNYKECPYYRSNDDYKIVRHQM